MRARLDDLSLMEDVYHVCLLDGAETMCNCNCSPTPSCNVQGRLNQRFRLGIYRRGCFVEEQDFWIPEKCLS